MQIFRVSTSGLRCSLLPFKWSTGNNISGHYFQHYFLLSPQFFPIYPPPSTFLIKGVLTVEGSPQKPRNAPFPDPIDKFGAA